MAEPRRGQVRGRVRSPVRRPGWKERALVERWKAAGPDELWSLLDAAWLSGITQATLRRYVADGRLAGTTNQRGHCAVRTEDLRPLVEAGGRTYGPAGASTSAVVDDVGEVSGGGSSGS